MKWFEDIMIFLMKNQKELRGFYLYFNYKFNRWEYALLKNYTIGEITFIFDFQGKHNNRLGKI